MTIIVPETPAIVPACEFPHVVDNTMISGFRRCEMAGYYHGIRRIVKHEESTHLVAGGAFAKGLEITRKCYFDGGFPLEDSLEQGAIALIKQYGGHEPHPKVKVKSCQNMVAALYYYFHAFPIDKQLVPLRLANGKHAVEFSFAIPTGVKHPVTGDPILYAGRFDMIGMHETGIIYVVDEKTSTQLGDQWLARWRMSNQMTGYIWAARESGIDVKGAWIRGLGMLSSSFTSANVPTLRPQWRIEAWHRNLTLTLYKMISAWKHGVYQQNLDNACSAYGGCSYVDLCEVQEPERWIPINYHPNTWSPLNSRD